MTTTSNYMITNNIIHQNNNNKNIINHQYYHNQQKQKQQQYNNKTNKRNYCYQINGVVINIFLIRTIVIISSISGMLLATSSCSSSRSSSTSFVKAFVNVGSTCTTNRNSRSYRCRSSVGSRASFLHYNHYQSRFLSSSLSLSSSLVSNSTSSTTTIRSTNGLLTNRQLAEQHLRTIQIQKQERHVANLVQQQRNLQLKEQLINNNKNHKFYDTTTNDTNDNTTDNLIAIKVTVDPIIRNELKLSGREKRGRVFVSSTSNATKYYKSLRGEIHGFFRALKKDTYIIQASLLYITTTTTTPNNNNTSYDGNADYDNNNIEKWTIENDDDVVKTFERAQQYFHEQQQLGQSTSDNTNTNTNQLKRPSIVLYINKNPNGPKPLPPPPYLVNLPNPDDSPTISMISFYSFGNISDPYLFVTHLKQLWEPFHVLGRVYIATEGMNAQMSVPTNVLQQFITCCEYYMSLPTIAPNISEQLRAVCNGINVDPIPLTREEYAVAGTPSASAGDIKPSPPFTNLHIRVRQQIVSDGLDKSYDWNKAGYDMPPLEWHAKLQEAKRLREQQQLQQQKQHVAAENEEVTTKAVTSFSSTTTADLPIILDCRNTYETDVGIFEGAIPLNTDTFKDTWDAIDEKLATVPKDAPIMMYCTGGIRCVKVGAYVTQELGFTNVSRLAGGIIAYDRAINTMPNIDNNEFTKANTPINMGGQLLDSPVTDTVKLIKSMFKGTNFVFDGRLGRKITDDALGTCVTCGSNTTLVSNCRNNNCHKRMVQCATCRTSFLGTCSDACHNRLLMLQQKLEQKNSNEKEIINDNNLSIPESITDTPDRENQKEEASTSCNQPVFTTIDEYCRGHSSPIPDIYDEMEYNTKALIPAGSHMVSGQSQGRLLKQFASMTREGRILEVGTFTGYATACLFEGAIEAGKIIGSTNGSRYGGPYVLSMERDAKAYGVAIDHFSVISEHGFRGDNAAEAMCALRSRERKKDVKKSQQTIPPVKLDDNMVVSFKIQSQDMIATCELMKVSDALATLEEMASGSGRFNNKKFESDYIAPFDLVFVDADKTRLVEYVEACLKSERILKKGGLIVVDNVLWKGLVLEASGRGIGNNSQGFRPELFSPSSQVSDDDGDNDSDISELQQLRKNRRARKLANKMHRFNSEVVKDDRIEVLVLPIRDGLSVIRKK